MDGLNTSFCKDPVAFTNSWVVNLTQLMPFTIATTTGEVSLINNTKSAVFDFAKKGFFSSQAMFTYIKGTEKIANDVGVLGYFCPFNQGTATPGWVDVPRHLALHRFVFTPTMNGCAFVITNSPTAGCFRVHHHQHPGPGEVAMAGGGVELDRLAVAEYSPHGDDTVTLLTQKKLFGCFNFLRHDGTRWKFVSQRNQFSLTDQGNWSRMTGEETTYTRDATVV